MARKPSPADAAHALPSAVPTRRCDGWEVVKHVDGARVVVAGPFATSAAAHDAADALLTDELVDEILQEEAAITPAPETPTPTTRKHKEVWLVEDTAKGRSLWTRVGTAFVNADGSLTLRLSALPVGAGTLMIR